MWDTIINVYLISWCLEELAEIVKQKNEKGHKVFPIFYDVNPSDLRKQKEKVEGAFTKHEDRYKEDKEKILRWRNALTQVANIKGWHLNNGHEPEFIGNIVRKISAKLCQTYPVFHDELVGISSRLEELYSKIEIVEDDIRIIGICGMGGIGKTTLARVVYDQMSSHFEGKCFIADVREVSDKFGLVSLQKQLLFQILSGEVFEFFNVHEGNAIISHRLSNKKVLVVIDDVDNIQHLKCLVGRHDWFGLGSRIIITTRDEHLLQSYRVDDVYKPSTLNDSEALQLFSLKAFDSETAPVGVSVSSAVFIIALSIAVYVIIKIKNTEVVEDWELDIDEVVSVEFTKEHLINSNTQVAVKRVSHESKQGLREFVAEISSTRRLRQRNLVQLLGWCRRRGDLLLVYNFMANGSLDKFLFDDPKTTLNWDQRFRIIKDVASGLLYLHEGYEQIAIHRDVKASNVFLDDELNARLGDFSLARFYEHGSNPGTSRIVGTMGYIAPELPRTGKATTSSDVYAFGALLLEVSCGRRPIDLEALPEELVLVEWVWEKFRQGRVLDVVDTRLNGQYDEGEMMMVLKLGLICSNHVPVARPSMRKLVRYLDGEVDLPENLTTPVAFDGGAEGFDAFVHFSSSSSSSPSLDNMISYPFLENGNAGTS